MAETPDPFDPARLRLYHAAELIGIKRVIANVPIRRPKRQEFVRHHPDPGQQFDTALIERPSASLL